MNHGVKSAEFVTNVASERASNQTVIFTSVRYRIGASEVSVKGVAINYGPVRMLSQHRQ